MNSQQILDKITTRNILAVSIIGGFFGVLGVYVFMAQYKPPEIVLGALISIVTLVAQFYFRKAQSKESNSSNSKAKGGSIG